MRLRFDYSGVVAALLLAAMLSGCANPEVFDSNERWFSKSFDWSGRNGGYAFSEFKGVSEKQKPVSANELVSASGACPPPPFTASVPAPSAPSAGPMSVVPQSAGATPGGPGAMPGADGATPDATAASPLLGGGVALGMTECQVVWRAGAPASVQIGAKPNGERTAEMTFEGGPRPGIYHFEGGRLMDMDSLAINVTPAPRVAKRRERRRREPPAPEERISTE